MRVYSKYKDYYDSATSLGIDENVVYHRTEETIYLSEIYGKKQYKNLLDEIQKIKDLCFEKHKYYNFDRELVKSLIPCKASFHNQTMYYPSLVIIGFCGHLYPLIKLFGKMIYYDLKEMNNYILSNYTSVEDVKKFKEIETMLNNIRKHNAKKLFIDLDSPVFLLSFRNFELDHPRITKNNELKKYEFYKVKNVIEAHSEIEQFISNTLVKRDEIKPVSDEIKLLNHGFDKLSFRKEKSVKTR